MDLTSRDRVWSAALELAGDNNRWRGFKVRHVREQIGDDAPSDKTIQRVLRAMTETGYIKHKEGSPRYRPGPRLRELQEQQRSASI